MLDLIEKNSMYKVELIYLLFESDTGETIEELSNYFEMDKRTIRKLIYEIENDIKKDESIKITRKKDKSISIKKEDSFDIQDIVLFYFKNSINFKLCMSFFHKEFTTITRFCSDNYLTVNVFSKRVYILKKFLKKFSLKLNFNSKNILLGEEIQIRYFYYYVFWNSYRTVAWPFIDISFDDMYKKVYTIMNENENKIVYSDIYKAVMWLSITINRLKNGCFLKESIIDYPINRNDIKFKLFFERLESVFRDIGIQDEKIIINEIEFLFFGLNLLGTTPIINFGLVNDSDFLYEDLYTDKYNSLLYSHKWIKEFCSFFDIKITQDQFQYLCTNLMVLHNRVIFLKGPSVNYSTLISEKKLKNEFPFHYDYMKGFYNHLIDKKILDSLLVGESALVLQYVMLTLDIFKNKKIKLNIYVSSSMGELQEYNLCEYIIRHTDVPIIVDKSITISTDLIITDFTFPRFLSLGKKIFLTSTFPTEAQKKRLNDILIELHSNKMKKNNLPLI